MSITTKQALWLINFLIAAVFTWFAVSVGMSVFGHRLDTNQSQTGPAPVVAAEQARKRSLTEYQAIVRHNIFGAQEVVETTGPGPSPVTPSAGPGSPNLRLRGTVDGEKYSMAIIENRADGQQDLYKPGDRIGAVEIARVERDKVILKQGERETELPLFVDTSDSSNGRPPIPMPSEPRPLPDGAGGDSANALSQQVGPGRFIINREELGRKMANLNQLLTTVIIQPHFVQGKPQGYRIASVKKGSPAQQLGIQNGDVIMTVNDVPVGSPEDMINMYQQLQQLENGDCGRRTPRIPNDHDLCLSIGANRFV